MGSLVQNQRCPRNGKWSCPTMSPIPAPGMFVNGAEGYHSGMISETEWNAFSVSLHPRDCLPQWLESTAFEDLMKHFTVPALMAVAFSPPLPAQDRLEEVVVVASRYEMPLREVGASVSVITRDDIELQGYPTVAE